MQMLSMLQSPPAARLSLSSPFHGTSSFSPAGTNKSGAARIPQFGGSRRELRYTTRRRNLLAVRASDAPSESSSKMKDLVFVAGSTGRVGSRTVRELLKLGFRVRAGVRSSARAQSLVQSVRQMKLDDAAASSDAGPLEKLEVVECDLENRGEIAQAIANASVVICCIGASEKEAFDITGPYRIDYLATKNLIDAAAAVKVEHFILLTSLGTNKIGFPAAILNLFWGVLLWKRKAEEALFDSGIPYTIVRPGGMERPTDSFKETHNLVLASEDTYFGGLVSNLQVAELMACMAKNKQLSYCKVVEVIAETTAPLLPIEELLAKIPSKRALPASLILEPAPPSVAEPSSPDPSGAPKTRPLSPFYMYDNLKPPSSPTPSAPSATPKAAAAEASPSADGANPLSPTDGLNPPTSPSPGAPAATENGPAPTKNHRPLSPYTMYEDMKPPTSPVPSVPKI